MTTRDRSFPGVCGEQVPPEDWAAHQAACGPCGTPPFAELEESK